MPQKPNLILGIAGPSCSGKSTLARYLQKSLPGSVGILPLDAYYRDLSHLSPKERGEQNFDLPTCLDSDLLGDHLKRLTEGQSVEVPSYDFESHTRRLQGNLLAPCQHLIVEGLYSLYWSHVRRLFDVAVFVEAPDLLCLARRRHRDVRERGRTEDEVLRQYLATVRPMAEKFILPTRRFADLVVQGQDSVENAASKLGLVLPRRQAA